MRVGWQREKRVPNFNESRVAKGGFGLSKLNLNYVFWILKVVC